MNQILPHPELTQDPAGRTAIRSGRGDVRYVARLALDDRTIRDAYALRYSSYLHSGYIEPNETALFSDQYDGLANCKSIVIYAGSAPVAAVRTCSLAHGSAQTSPAKSAYPDEVRDLLGPTARVGGGGKAIEITRLVRSPSAANNQGLVFLLYRLAGHVGITEGAEVILACVRQNHAAFYRRMGYEAMSEPRPYPGLNCQMQLMACSRARYEQLRAASPALDPYSGRNGKLDGFLDGAAVSLSLL